MQAFGCSAFGYLIKAVPGSSTQWLPSKALHSLHVGSNTLQLLPHPVLTPESPVSIRAGHLSGTRHCTERPFAKWLFPSASWEMGDEERQLPLSRERNGLRLLLALVSTHSGQYPTNQEGEMPAGLAADSLLGRSWTKQHSWPQTGPFSKSIGMLGC